MTFSAARRVAWITASMAGCRIAESDKTQGLLDGLLGDELREAPLFRQSKLRKTDRAGLLFDNLHELHRRFDVDDMRSLHALAAEQLGLRSPW